MRPDRVVLVDHMPLKIGVEALDWAGIQLSRLWAVPLTESRCPDDVNRDAWLETIERLDDHTWRLTPRAEMNTMDSRFVLASWRKAVARHGSRSFFFLRRARIESTNGIIVTTRLSYPEIRSFLEAPDLWPGLALAAEEWIGRVQQDSWSEVRICGRTVRVQVVRDVEAAKEYESSNPDAETIRCGLPGPFPAGDAATSTALPYVMIPRRPVRSTIAGDMGAVLEAMRARPSFERGFLPSPDAGYLMPESEARGDGTLRVSFTDYFPNADVCRALVTGIRATLPERKVHLSERSYGEGYEPSKAHDYDLAILTPVNASTTGGLRSILAYAGPDIDPRERGAIESVIDTAELTGAVDVLRAAHMATYTATGVGLLGHYMGFSGEPGSSNAVSSSLGFVPLEKWKYR